MKIYCVRTFTTGHRIFTGSRRECEEYIRDYALLGYAYID